MRRYPDPYPVIPTQRCGVPPHLDERGAVPAQRTTPDQVHDELSDLRGLVHDLGNGLSTLAVLLQAAREGAAPTFGLLETVEQETARLLSVLHSAHRRPGPRPDPVGVRDVLAPLVRVAACTGRTAVRLLPGADARVRVDRAALSRVVGNLVDNAVRAAGAGGTVLLAVREVDGSADRAVVVDVVDDGPGFPAGPPGTAGLGLDLVTRLLTAHDGRLEIDAVAPRGTRARVVLPAAG